MSCYTTACRCPKCGKPPREEEITWDDVCETIECQSCGALLDVHADESYDPETGEELAWFFVELHKD